MRCAGFLSVYMRSECRKSCQLCIPDSPTEAPKAPAVERPPEPACDKAPDAGSACPFFFSSLVVSHSGGGLIGPCCCHWSCTQKQAAPGTADLLTASCLPGTRRVRRTPAPWPPRVTPGSPTTPAPSARPRVASAATASSLLSPPLRHPNLHRPPSRPRPHPRLPAPAPLTAPTCPLPPSRAPTSW